MINKKLLKSLKIIYLISSLFIYFLVFFESFKYQGFVRNHLRLPLEIFLILAIVFKFSLVNFIKKRPYFVNLDFFVGLIFLTIGFFGYLLDSFNYSGFFYTAILHIDPVVLIKNTLWILISYFLINLLFFDFRFILNIFFLFLSLYIFFDNWFKFAFSNFPIDEFDGALRILVHYYTKRGLTPYKDFGFVYPPGLILLIGKIIPFTSIFQRNLVLGLIFIFILFVNIFLLYLILQRKKYLFSISLFILLSSINIGNIAYDPLSIPLMTTFLLSTIIYFIERKTPNRFVIFTLFLTPIFVFFLRWDFILFFILLTNLFYILFLKFWLKGRKYFSEHIKYKIIQLLKIQNFGLILAITLLLFYLLSINSFKEGLDFIFNIPTLVIMPYRRLPLPTMSSIFNINASFYISLLVYLINLALISDFLFLNKKNIKSLFIILLLIVAPLFAVPYALGRADWVHSLPFLYFLAVCLIIWRGLFKQSKDYSILLLMILIMPTYSFFLPNKEIFLSKYLLKNDIDMKLKNCKQSIMKINHLYNSIFIGRITYEKYIANAPAIYLINPNVPPATAFISDEPGLQNSCYYGYKIVSQLKRAKKPILAFLETGIQQPEPNKTQSMRSCGKIEEFLTKNKYLMIGKCYAFNRNFEIRLYK